MQEPDMPFANENPTGMRVRSKDGAERMLGFPEFVKAVRAGEVDPDDQVLSWIVTRNRWMRVGSMRLYDVVRAPGFRFSDLDFAALRHVDEPEETPKRDRPPPPEMPDQAAPVAHAIPRWWLMEGEPEPENPPPAKSMEPARMPVAWIFAISMLAIPACYAAYGAIYQPGVIGPGGAMYMYFLVTAALGFLCACVAMLAWHLAVKGSVAGSMLVLGTVPLALLIFGYAIDVVDSLNPTLALRPMLGCWPWYVGFGILESYALRSRRRS